jgi:hypothetical protein
MSIVRNRSELRRATLLSPKKRDPLPFVWGPYNVKKIAENLRKRGQMGHLGDLWAFSCHTSPKRGEKTQLYIILHRFFSLPGPKMGTPTPFTKNFPKIPTLSPLKNLPPLPPLLRTMDTSSWQPCLQLLWRKNRRLLAADTYSHTRIHPPQGVSTWLLGSNGENRQLAPDKRLAPKRICCLLPLFAIWIWQTGISCLVPSVSKRSLFPKGCSAAFTNNNAMHDSCQGCWAWQ